jgi:hypothetical protein
MFRRRRDALPELSVAVDRGTEPIALVTPDRVVEGWTRPLVGRLTESLNAGTQLDVEVGSERGIPQWQAFQPRDLLAVAPMPYGRPRDGWTRRSVVLIRVGRYQLRGVVCVPVGVDEERYLLEPDQPWLPLTDASLGVDGDDWTAKVVIANLDHATELVRTG